MSDSVIQTLIIVVGVLAIAWPLIKTIRDDQNGVSALKKYENSLLADKLKQEYNKKQIESKL